MLDEYHNPVLLWFFQEITEIPYKSGSSEALQIQEHNLQNYSSLYRSLVVLNGLWLEWVRNVSVEQVILLEEKHFMGTYLSETRSLNLNLLEPKRYCLPRRRIFLQLPGNCKNFCLNNKQKHFVYIIKCGESLLPISHKTDDPDLQPLLGLTGECGGDNSCCPSHCWPCQLSVLLTGAVRAIYAGCSATLICSHVYPQLTSNFHLH